MYKGKKATSNHFQEVSNHAQTDSDSNDGPGPGSDSLFGRAR